MSKSPKPANTNEPRGSVSSLVLSGPHSRPAVAFRRAMQKPGKIQDKYFLKSLHEEIDLYDRKLAHTLKYGIFPSDQERQVEAGKITVKRAGLERNAKALMAAGVEFR